jgi:hypothetical protein
MVMLACVVGIPALAMSGASWSEILKKFQDFHWPAILTAASASTSTPETASEAPRFTPNRSTDGQSGGEAMAAGQPGGPNTRLQPPSANPPLGNLPVEACGLPVATTELRGVQERLRELGATYYLLESWGSDQQLYRFYCKVAVGGNADYTHWFEVIHADPLQAMRQVLRRVETWRGEVSMNVGRNTVE